MRDKISTCVLTYNEERKIERCLRSISWSDEIVIMDSFSTDATLTLCRRYTERVYQHEWEGYVGQRNLIRDMATHPWILFLDSDEEVSPVLRDEILAEFERGTGKYVGYSFPRKVYFLGKWVRHGEWYPDVKLRLFKKACGHTEGQEPHDRVVVDGPVKQLKNPLWHYTYDDMRDYLDTLNRFSTITAQQRFAGGARFGWTDVVFRPALRFLKGYILRGGFLDGAHGFMVATVNSFGVFAKYSKLWEQRLKNDSRYREWPEESPPLPVDPKK
jgi:glycosyltransferase involved in cell wall biosynthesis